MRKNKRSNPTTPRVERVAARSAKSARPFAIRVVIGTVGGKPKLEPFGSYRNRYASAENALRAITRDDPEKRFHLDKHGPRYQVVKTDAPEPKKVRLFTIHDAKQRIKKAA